MSKAELARRANMSPLTINRVESGEDCRLDTKRKIILALGKQLTEKEAVFPGLAKDHDDTGNSETTETVSRQSTPHEDE